MSHRTKLTESVQKRLVEAFRRGSTARLAAQYGGISERTLYTWMEKGRNAQRGPFRRLFDAIETSQAEAQIKCLAVIDMAMGCGPTCKIEHDHILIDWKAAAWKLERSHPEEWGRGPRQAPKPERVRTQWEKLALSGPPELIACKIRFLESVEEWSALGPAAQAAGLCALDVLAWLNADPDFARAFEFATDLCNQHHQGRLYKAGTEGDVTALFGHLNAHDPNYGPPREAIIDRRLARVADAIAEDVRGLPDASKERMRKKVDRIILQDGSTPAGRKLK